MSAFRGAILAVVCLPAVAGPLDEPLHVRFELTDGVGVSGRMVSWDQEGFDGTFGPRFWEELAPQDAWRIHLRVMDQNDPSQWVNLGRVLLLGGHDVWADRAFRRALDLDSSVAGDIEAARRDAGEAQRLRDELETMAIAQRLETGSPEAVAWPADPWPALTPSQQQAAILEMKDDALGILREAGRPLRPLETANVLLYCDGAPIDAARWALALDAVHTHLAELLGIAPGRPIFRGKAVVIIVDSDDLFRLIEAEAFGWLVPRQTPGIFHPVGPKVFLCFPRRTGDVMSAALVHQMVHGFLHRYRTPCRLPAWANEGLAEHTAAVLAGRSVVPGLREMGLEFVRAGGNVQQVLDLAYGDGWPGAGRTGDAVGALLIELMIRERPAGFRAWVDAVKDGKDWEPALEENFGVPRAQLVETFVQYYRVND